MMFYLFGSPDSAYYCAKPYAILIALPFFYASTSYWGDDEVGEYNKRNYFGIQAIGIFIGFVSGHFLWGYSPITKYLNHATLWEAINYVMRP